MATLKLPKKNVAATAERRDERRKPVRGVAAARKRPTLAQAQAERAAEDERRRSEPARKARTADATATERQRGNAQRAQPAPQTKRSAAFARTEPTAKRPDKPAPKSAPPRKPRPASQAASPKPDHRPPAWPRPPVRPARLAEPPPTRDSRAHPEGERLSKRMTALGLASRREADEWIEAGWVRVNGRLAVLGQRVPPDARIEIDPRARREQLQRVTLLLHKPIGYVSGQPEDGYPSAATLIRPETLWREDASRIPFNRAHLRGLAPAGRLDIDSTGLLVLTQDGRIAKLLIGDDSRVEKEYLVRVQYAREGRLPEASLALLNHGLALDGQALNPAKVSWQNEDQLRFVLREGKKRQIRRMCELVGLKVLGLKRVRIGSVVLGKLPMGQWRYLRSDERFA